MKRHRPIRFILPLFALAIAAQAQTTSTPAFAPANFGNRIFTALPSNATSSVGVSSIYGSDGTAATFGTGGALVNPAEFTYTVTGPDSATISTPANDSTLATTTNLTFTGDSRGTYRTTSGGETLDGTFSLSEIPFDPPLSNLSVRTSLTTGESATVGFFVAGTMPRRVLIRAVGPGLAAFGVKNGLANPALSLFRGTQTVASNDDWETAATVNAGSGGGSTGAAGATATLGGTTRTGVTNADTTSIGGTSASIAGNGTSNTGSTGSGVAGTAGDNTTGPMGAGGVSSVDNTSNTTGILGANGTESTAATSAFSTSLANAQVFSQLGAFDLTRGSRDAAIVATLQPGAYTVMVNNSAAATGTTNTGTINTGSTGTGSGPTNIGISTSGAGTANTGTGTGRDVGTGTSSGGAGATPTIAGAAGTGTGSSGTTAITTAATATGEVLVEVYFIE
jgi:hypothetical protein